MKDEGYRRSMILLSAHVPTNEQTLDVRRNSWIPFIRARLPELVWPVSCGENIHRFHTGDPPRNSGMS